MHRRRPVRVRRAEALYYRPRYEYTAPLYETLLEDDLKSRSELWEQRVSVQPHQAAFLISATNPPVLIESNAAFTEGPMGTFHFSGLPTEAVTYTVFSEFALPSEGTLRKARAVTDREDFDGTVRRFYLTRVPLSPKSAAVLNDEIKIADYATPYEKIRAIKEFLEENYTYTFDIERPAGDVDAIENFLVNTKHGHCEYFASAMALMLKECEIPARLVYGYMTTPQNWNRFFGGSFVIRRCDAHAWVEAALVIDDRLQWVPFDPSPRRARTSPPASILGQFFQGVSKFFEALKARWHESIVAFDSSYQNRIAARIETTLADMRRSALANLNAAWDSIRWIWAQLTRTRLTAVLTPLALACLVSAGVLLMLRRIRRQARFHRAYVENQPERQVHTVRFYERMLRALLQHDIVKPAGQTPDEFAQSFQAHTELRPVVAGLTRLYYAVRFGNSQLTGTQIRWVHEALGTLRRSLSARAPAGRPSGTETA